MVLYSFAGEKDGAYPVPGVAMDGAGILYGVAGRDGDAGCEEGQGEGCGVVFEITP